MQQWFVSHKRLAFVFLLVVVDIAIGSTLFCVHPGHLTVAFLDIGQGDAVFIEGPNGNQVLYDAGPPDGALLRALPRVMPFWDRSLDMMIMSHSDQDHIGGFPDLLRRNQVTLALEPGVPSENGVYAEVERDILEEEAGHFLARRGMMIDLGEGVVMDVLYPDRDVSKFETNSASIVMRIRYGETSFLLSGDLPSNIEEYLVTTEEERLHANVLKLGHHGSRTSSSLSWLTAVHPDIAVASLGLNNRYGHPHKEVLERLDSLHIPLLRTDQEGTIIFTSDGKSVVRVK
jgi:competence protein ComEC